MRKILFICFIFISVLFIAQTSVGGQTGVPTLSNLPTSIDSPPGIASGIPKISVPLFNLPTHSKSVNINLALNYNPAIIKNDEIASEVGLGWGISMSGVIYREVESGAESDVDDFQGPTAGYSSVIYTHYLNNIYYFSIPGGSGKFKVIKNSSGDYEIVMLTPSSFKIQYTPGPPHDNFLEFTNFTIIDNNGNKYYFNTRGFNASYRGPTYNTAFYLDKITLPNDKEIVNYTYENRDTPLYTGSSDFTRICKLKKIVAVDIGSLEYVNDYYKGNGYSDPYSIEEITLKDVRGNSILKYTFNYGLFTYRYRSLSTGTGAIISVQKRILNGIDKKDKFSTFIERTVFQYDTKGFAHHYGSYIDPQYDGYGPLLNVDDDLNPKFETLGTLKTILLPTGGKVEYTFTANEEGTYSVDRTTPEFEQSVQDGTALNIEDLKYLVRKDSIWFDTNLSTSIPFPINKKGYFYVKFNKNQVYDHVYGPDDPHPVNPYVPSLGYKLSNTSTSNIGGTLMPGNTEASEWFAKEFYASIPDNYKINLTGEGNGWVEIYTEEVQNPPYYNAVPRSGIGVRIDNIKYYTNRGDAVPIKTVYYDYLRRDKLRTISYNVSQSGIMYENVTINNSTNNGYEVYFHNYTGALAVDDPLGKYIPYLNIDKNPTFSKKETYDAQNNKVSEFSTNYIYSELEPKYLSSYGSGSSSPSIYTKTAFIQKQTNVVRNYNASGNFIETTSETNFSPNNFGVSSEKVTSTDGTIVETNYQYAFDKGNTKLLGANMLSVPLEVSQKQNNVEINKIETNYDQTDNYFPSSAASYGINGIIKDEQRNDIYDEMGNVLQSTSKTGIPTTYIYGYNSTLLIAKINGIKYADLMTIFSLTSTPSSYKSLDIYTTSNLDIDDASEVTLEGKLDEFRLKPLLKDYQITTYTYDPLIGVKSMTSPSGNKEYYFYDDANRLIRTEDINHNIIKESQYHINNPN